MKKLITLLISFSATIGLFAYDFEVDGICYNITGDNTVEVTYKVQYFPSYSGKVNLPETVTNEGRTYSVKAIGDYAFYNCLGLTSVTISEGVTKIGIYAFNNCIGLTSLTISSSISEIGEYVFDGCFSLESISVVESNEVFASIDGVLYTKDIKTLVKCPGGKSGSFTIPKGVNEIGKHAFYACSNILSVSIPSSVTEIGVRAFGSCTGLESINVDESNEVFASIDGVLYTKDIKTLIQCPGGKAGVFSIPEGVTEIGEEAFRVCGDIVSVIIPEGVTSIGNWAFQDCKSLISVTIPDGVVEIGNGAFYGCGSLLSVAIPEGITEIGEYTFYYCSSLNSVLIPPSVISIWDGAFSECSSLTVVAIPEGVTTIGAWAFYGCRSLTLATISSSVSEIGFYAFEDCSSLTSLYSYAVTPPVCAYYIIDDLGYTNCTLYVPEESLDAYKETEYWREFLNIEPFDNSSVESIEITHGDAGHSNAQKVVKNGRIYIVKGDKVYNTSGMEIR